MKEKVSVGNPLKEKGLRCSGRVYTLVKKTEELLRQPCLPWVKPLLEKRMQILKDACDGKEVDREQLKPLFKTGEIATIGLIISTVNAVNRIALEGHEISLRELMDIGKELTQKPLREVCYRYLLQKGLIKFKVGKRRGHFILTEEGEKLLENLKGKTTHSEDGPFEDSFLLLLLSDIKKYTEIVTTIKMEHFL